MNVPEIFESMEYGPAPESSAEAMAWIDGHKGKFGQYINGQWTKPAKIRPLASPEDPVHQSAHSSARLLQMPPPSPSPLAR